MGSTRSRRAPSWHERERVPEPDPRLEAGDTVEYAQHLGARNPRITKLYDRTGDEIRSIRSSG